MKLTTNREQFVAELKIAVACMSKKAAVGMPILTNALLTAANKTLRISVTDLETTVLTVVDAEVEEHGATCIDMKKLLAASGAGGGEFLAIETTENQRVKLVMEGAKYEESTQPAEDFPTTPEIERKPRIDFEVAPASLLAALSHVGSCIPSFEDERGIVKGAVLMPSADDVALFTTDGHRMALASLAIPGFEAKPVLLPPAIVACIPRVIHASELPARLSVGEDQARLSFVHRSLFFRLHDFSVVNGRAIIEKETAKPPTVIISNGKILAACIARSMATLDETSTKSGTTFREIRVAFEHGKLTASAAWSTGQSESVTALDYQGEPFIVTMNGPYLMDYFNTLELNARIKIELRDRLSSIIFRDANAEAPESIYLVMPIVEANKTRVEEAP